LKSWAIDSDHAKAKRAKFKGTLAVMLRKDVITMIEKGVKS